MAGPNPKKHANEPKVVDWAGMKPHWQAGILSIAELARRFNCSRPAITKHWEKAGVERNLTAQIQAEAQSLVHKAEASGGQIVASSSTQPEPGSDKETVAVNARMQAEVMLRHRKDILRAQQIAGALITELASQTFDAKLYERLHELLLAAGKAGRVDKKALAPLMALYERTTTTTNRSENLRRLSETMRVLTELERKVLGIADDTPIDPTERVQEAVESGIEKLREKFKARGVKV